MMKRDLKKIRNVAVLGSGTMGSQIAAHCVNAGLNVWLLDLKSEDASDPDKIVNRNIDRLRKLKPPALAISDLAEQIQSGNFEDDLEILRGMDWICEAVTERMEIKRELLEKVERMWTPGTIVSSNTSGLPIGEISRESGPEFRHHFLGMHFFNPPRYMKLVEIIPTEQTSRDVADKMISFCEAVLGKGVVKSHDTPNFIANRIGVFSMASILPWFFNGDFKAEEIDQITGTVSGYSKAATFRTADIVGIDVLQHVAENLYPAVPGDEKREIFRLPEKINEMIEKGWLGNKAEQGFYKKITTDKGKKYLALDPSEMSYEPQKEVAFRSLRKAKESYSSTEERLRYLVSRDDEVGKFLWKIQCDLLLYSANRIPEITSSLVSIDRAMKWGFNWELGPFERWDALGVEESVKRMNREGIEVPESVLRMLKSGRKSFYENGTVYNLADGTVEQLPPPARDAVTVSILKRENKEVWGNQHAALFDMGDGVALLEFRTRNQTLGYSLIDSMETACKKVNEEFDALVIGHDHEHFSYGANLAEILETITKGERDKVTDAVEKFQRAAVGLRYLPFPVIAAVSGRVLGGGVEMMMHCDKVVAHHETYCGLVELGAGLIPAGGGTKELLRRMMYNVIDDEQADPVPFLRKTFKTIGMMKVSESAAQARKLGFLRKSDVIVMNRNRLLATAKKQAVAMIDAVYQPPKEPKMRVMGREGYGILKLMIHIMAESGYISPYDEVLAEKAAYVLSGGNLSEPQEVPESYLLGLEREAVDHLLDDERTFERMKYLLKNGKPLRN